MKAGCTMMSKPGDPLKMDLVLIANGIINMDISKKMIFNTKNDLWSNPVFKKSL